MVLQLKRSPGIGLALSAWESDRLRPVTPVTSRLHRPTGQHPQDPRLPRTHRHPQGRHRSARTPAPRQPPRLPPRRLTGTHPHRHHRSHSPRPGNHAHTATSSTTTQLPAAKPRPQARPAPEMSDPRATLKTSYRSSVATTSTVLSVTLSAPSRIGTCAHGSGEPANLSL
jgi:hypothetical protein